MPSRVRLNPQASRDLRELADWIIDRADADTADTYVGRIMAKCATLADYPRRGGSRMDVAADLRSIPFERRLTILYRVDEDGVEIIRVVSGARDLSKLTTRRSR